jgi:Raf kinase inhibitor-like YbhB/YbcL family protein
MDMHIMSPSFLHDRDIPARHTCDGQNISPSISWGEIPPGAKSLVLIVDDPDAPDPLSPKMTWAHWLLYNIPVKVTGLAEGRSQDNLPDGTFQGMNDWLKTGYGGPCPPVGRHRYCFKLYALDSVLPDLKQPSRAVLENAMKDHILAQATLTGLYKRPAGIGHK